MDRAWSPEESRAYTRWLATHHYENFHVVSLLLPKRLHQDFYNVYSFCRWADDLGDEIGDTAESLRLLAWWRSELQAMCAGHAQHPVFVALAGTVREFSLPVTLFDDLIKAFEQDQTRHAVPRLRGTVRVLPLFRESRRAPGAGSVRISRPGAAGAFRRHLHGAATSQFLAGRHGRSRKRPGVFAAGFARSPRLSVGGAVCAPVRSALSRRDAGGRRTSRAGFFSKDCRSRIPSIGAWP